jgi:hypothetical protein
MQRILRAETCVTVLWSLDLQLRASCEGKRVQSDSTLCSTGPSVTAFY